MASDTRTPPASWASWLSVILGVWLIISPWVVGFAGDTMATWNTLILGIVVVLLGFYATRTADPTPSWLNVALGIWLIVSPWVLGFTTSEGAMANSVILGVITGMLALIVALAREAPGRRVPAP